jgi:hypothetical protein
MGLMLQFFYFSLRPSNDEEGRIKQEKDKTHTGAKIAKLAIE